MMKRLLIGLSALVFALCCNAQVGALPKTDASLSDATDAKFHPGDIWVYKTRPGEERSRLTILKVEKSPELGTIVHVAVDHVALHNCYGGPQPDAIPHMPFTRKVLEESVSRRVGTPQRLPTFRDGYDEWRASYSKKHAGIYIIPVSEAVSVAEYTYRRGIGCESDKSR